MTALKKRGRALSGKARVAQTRSLRDLVRATGLRATAPRIAVLERLGRAMAPMTHAEMTEALLPLGFDPATIYRNLTDLAGVNLVARVEVGDHVWRFELRAGGRADSGEHPHFACNDCGTIACLPSVSVNIRPPPGAPRSGVASVSEVLLKGRCDHC